MRVADRLQQDIGDLIREQGLKPGNRLPSERALAEQLGASRSSLREALRQMQNEGRIAVRQSGITLCAPPTVSQAVTSTVPDRAVSATLSALVADHPDFAQDVLEVRRALEGASSCQAALRADDIARHLIRDRLEALERASATGDAVAQSQADAAFHLAIAEASENVILHHIMANLFELLKSSISQSLEKLYLIPSTADVLAEQHRALYLAIEAGDAENARKIATTHLDFVESSIRRIDNDSARRARARGAYIPVNS